MTTDLDRLIEAVEAGDLSTVNNNLGVMYSGLSNYWPWDWISKVNSAFRGSIDAAVALLEALLPGAPFTAGRDSNSTFWAVVRQPDGTEVDINHDHSTARALLLATLRAYRSTSEAS